MPRLLSAPLRRLISGEGDGQTEYVKEMRLPGDAGLFGPDSVTWEVLSHASTLLGGIRSLLLQSLDPLTVAGVAEHSRFRSEPIGRLQTTARFVTVAAFGTTEQIGRECAVIRRVHERVKGMTPDGRPYAASNPSQLLFVHMALIQSFLVAYELFTPAGLSARDADRFVVEWNALAPLLAFDSVPLPQSRADLDRMLEEYGKGFQVGRDALEAFEFLADPPLAAPMRPAYRVLLTAAAGSLPPYARRMLPGFLPNPSRPVTFLSGSAIVQLLAFALGPSAAHTAALERVGR